MVRCVFYLYKNKVYQYNFEVDWSFNSNYQDKLRYVDEIEFKLKDSFKPCVDVTSYSQHELFKRISGYKALVGNKPFLQFWKEDVLTVTKEADDIPGLFDYLYLKSIGSKAYTYINQFKTFYDIYYNPMYDRNTIARSCIALKLLMKQRKLGYLKDMNQFMYWYYCNIGTMVIKNMILQNREKRYEK